MAKKSVSARPGLILEERSGPGWDQDGPGWPPPRDLDGSETLSTKHMANLDGTPSDPGWDLDRSVGELIF